MNNEIRKFLNAHLSVVDFQYDPIKKGGSDRNFYRVRLPSGSTFIFMEYGTEVEENAYWTEINRFLTEIGLPTPRIIAYDQKQRYLLLEDLGAVDLYAIGSLPWRKRRTYYLTALLAIRRLHQIELADLPASLKLTAGYDRSLYLWEHDYFKGNFIEAVCGLNLPDSLLSSWKQETEALIDRLQKIPPCLIHRDFQSQNIMIADDRPVFIDFQGMRSGNLFYDLASLICDPYVSFSPAERNELIAFYYRIMQPSYSLGQFTDNFWDGAAQRLMQALGAYGFLGLKKNKPDFLRHTDRGVQNLLIATANAGTMPVLNEITRNCQNHLKA